MVSAALVPICRVAAVRLGYATQRLPATKPKALFGGVAIALTVFGWAVATGAFATLPVLLLCSAGLFLVGLASDLFTLRPSTKLVAIVVVATAFLVFGSRLYWSNSLTLDIFGSRLYWSESLTLDTILTLFWIVGITSIFNLLDNMDGLCGGIALIAGTAFLTTLLPVAGQAEFTVQAQYLAVLLGAIAGLLIYNIHPASVVPGESGSLLIGVNMAAMPLLFVPGRGSDLLSIVAVPLLLLLIPILDTMLVAIAPLFPGSRMAAAGAKHSSHRLVAVGLPERTAVGLLWLLAAASGVIAVMADRGQGITGLMAATFTIGVALFGVYLARVKVHDDLDPDRLPASITPLGVEFGYRRRLAEVLLDIVLIAVAYYGAYRLLYDAEQMPRQFQYFLQSFPIVLGLQVIGFFLAGAYQGMWRYFSLPDGVTVAKGVFLGVVGSQAAILALFRFNGYSPATFVVYGMLVLLLVVGSRASFRLISEYVQRQRQTGRRLVIYGTGDAGSIAVRHLLNDPRSSYRIVGFIDDDYRMRNVRVHGYRVIGGYDHLVGMIVGGDVDAVAITDARLDAQGLAALAAKYGVSLHSLVVDWREILAEPRTAGSAALAPAESRVVRFTAAGREPAALRADRVASGPGPVAPVLAHKPATAPIRVVHIITRLILGGAQENTLYTTLGQHADPRFDVTLLCGIDEAGEGNLYEPAVRAGVNMVVLPSLLREIRPLTDVKAVFDVYRFLKRGGYTIVHTHSSKAGIIGRLAAWAAGVPVVIHTQHGLAFQSEWRNRIYVALERLCAPLTDVILSVSARLGESAIAEGIGRPDQHATIFSGIELDRFLSARERLTVDEAKRRAGIPADALVVGKIARLFELKGHEQFFAAAEHIARELPSVYFLLVGDGPLRAHLESEAARLGLQDRVVMVGRVAPELVPDYIQAMDVVVHTSLREGIARVLPQAGAVGKPVVTFDLDGAPEVIRDGVSGYLVAPVDTAAIAARVVELLRDPGRRQAFGEAGRLFAAEHFSVERMVERISDLYIQLTATAASSRRHGAPSAT
jgi:UDP-GlcNAc:undecaprenyl-phosphate GlcNAc-1-phosphate transferase